eukprot:GHVU01202288.1.p1 GENE.GHVU01202288.1~~GHVU01202288.1.p1  ORF type:complete len:153 (+),score=13.79 GHVU01202288.1:137-595(+)
MGVTALLYFITTRLQPQQQQAGWHRTSKQPSPVTTRDSQPASQPGAINRHLVPPAALRAHHATAIGLHTYKRDMQTHAAGYRAPPSGPHHGHTHDETNTLQPSFAAERVNGISLARTQIERKKHGKTHSCSLHAARERGAAGVPLSPSGSST